MRDRTDDILNDAEADESRERRKDIRRAVLGGVAGVAMLVGPIVLANAVVPDDGSDVQNEDDSATSLVAALRNQAMANQADSARALAYETTTTTTAPPTTTTTAAPTTTAPPETTTTTEEPVPVEPPPDTGGSAPDPYSYATWDQLAECESGGNWSINTGNGYYGGLQFSLSTWQGLGGTGYPHEHSRETQIAMGIRLYESSGWGAWPACTRALGWR